MREERTHDLYPHGLPFLHEQRPGELGEAPHFVQVHLLGHLHGVVDEVGAEECGDSQQAHGHGFGGPNGIDAFRVQQGGGKLLTLQDSGGHPDSMCTGLHPVAQLKGPRPAQQLGDEVGLPRAVGATDGQDSHRLVDGSQQL